MNNTNIVQKKYQNLARLADRFFLISITLQVVLVIGITAAFGFMAHYYSGQKMVTQVEKTFRDWEKRITEAVYVEEVLGTPQSTKLGQINAFEANLVEAGIPALVTLKRCGATIPNTLSYELTVGSRKLASCVYVNIRPTVLFENLKWILFAGFLSVLIAGMTWLLIRKRMNREVLKPLISDIEEKSRRVSLGEVATLVAHDIRSPLTVLRSVVGNMNGISEERRTLVLGAVGQIGGITDDLIKEYISLRNGVEFVRRPFEILDLRTQIDKIIYEKREEYISHEKLRLTASYGASELTSRIRPLDFSRVLSNLINNSVKAIGGSGEIKIDVTSEGGFASISVIDFGHGIAPELLPQLGNEPIDRNAQPNTVGAGIGLYYARKTIEALGGSLKISSTVGFGTTIEIKVPIWRKGSAAIKDVAQSPLHRLNAVLIDDDDFIRGLWALRAMDSNKRVKTFDSYEAFLKDHVPFETPIFIDQNLSRGDLGVDVAQRLHDLGYLDLHLATGEFDTSAINPPPFVKSVRGKDFPEYA